MNVYFYMELRGSSGFEGNPWDFKRVLRNFKCVCQLILHAGKFPWISVTVKLSCLWRDESCFFHNTWRLNLEAVFTSFFFSKSLFRTKSCLSAYLGPSGNGVKDCKVTKLVCVWVYSISPISLYSVRIKKAPTTYQIPLCKWELNTHACSCRTIGEQGLMRFRSTRGRERQGGNCEELSQGPGTLQATI